MDAAGARSAAVALRLRRCGNRACCDDRGAQIQTTFFITAIFLVIKEYSLLAAEVLLLTE